MSFYLTERKALFLHVPRTGGTWTKHAMYLAGIPMDNWGRICSMYRPRKHTMIPYIRPDLWVKVEYVFAFVRHPCEYYVSVWRFTSRAFAIHPKMMKAAVYGLKDPSAINEGILRWKPNFDEWLDEMLEEEPGWATRWFERFVGPPRGEYCHFIGRTETLEIDLGNVLSILNYGKRWKEASKKVGGIKQARNVVRVHRVPPVVLTDEQREKIERSERVLLRRFYGEETKDKRVYRKLTGEPT